MLLSVNEINDIIQQALKRELFDQQRSPRGLYEPIEYIMNLGGKRVRPALTLMACNLFNNHVQPALLPALGIEIFHNFTLLHDDVMDNSPLRRGNPTVHERWNVNTAILSGDAMCILANQLITRSRADIMPRIMDVYNRTALQVCEGQQMDIDFEKRNDVTVAEYLEMICLKTSVLLAAAAQIGAISGESSDNDAKLMYDFGLNLGLAFQLQDDYLDTFGDSSTFGKRIGGDIVSNKKTFLLIRAFELSQGEVRQALQQQIYGTPSDEQTKINIVTDIFRQLHVDQLAKDKMQHFYLRALTALGEVNAPDERKTLLRQFAKQMIERVK